MLPRSRFYRLTSNKQKLCPVSGRTILIHRRVGGVGSCTIQLAKLSGLTIISSCLMKKKDHVMSLGTNKVFDIKIAIIKSEEVSNYLGK